MMSRWLSCILLFVRGGAGPVTPRDSPPGCWALAGSDVTAMVTRPALRSWTSPPGRDGSRRAMWAMMMVLVYHILGGMQGAWELAGR